MTARPFTPGDIVRKGTSKSRWTITAFVGDHRGALAELTALRSGATATVPLSRLTLVAPREWVTA